MDSITKSQRSLNMSRIRSKDTKPEKALRSILHNRRFRFRKNVEGLPGKPDIVFSKYKTVIFVHGCFWHQHPSCNRSIMPKTNRKYWKDKFEKNITRDYKNIKKLELSNWHVIIVWECEIKNDAEEICNNIESVLNS